LVLTTTGCGSWPTRPLRNRPGPRQLPHRHPPKPGARTTTGLVRRVYEEGPCRIKRHCAACVPLVDDDSPGASIGPAAWPFSEHGAWGAILIEPGLFHPGEPNSNLLRVPVRNAVLSVIGLSSLAMEKAPLRRGIASFSRRSESYSEGHHVFILECHGVQRGGVIPNRGRTRAEGLAYKKTSRRVRFAPSDP
jgi:hypothetical protein